MHHFLRDINFRLYASRIVSIFCSLSGFGFRLFPQILRRKYRLMLVKMLILLLLRGSWHCYGEIDLQRSTAPTEAIDFGAFIYPSSQFN